MRALFLLLLLAVTGFCRDLIWSDEFNGSSLDSTKWKIAYPGERLQGFNSAESVSVSDGCLHIKVLTKNGKHYTGMVSTEGKFENTFGFYEARMKFHDAPATWSDFWLYHPRMVDSDTGIEIDILEHRQYDKFYRPIWYGINHTIHWDGYAKNHKCWSAFPNWGRNEEFHTVGLRWDEAGYQFFVDGYETSRGQAPVVALPLFIIFSTEIETHGWAGDVPADGYSERETLAVDWVRVYK